MNEKEKGFKFPENMATLQTAIILAISALIRVLSSIFVPPMNLNNVNAIMQTQKNVGEFECLRKMLSLRLR